MEFISRLKFWLNTDRLGPDIPTSHWLLYFPNLANKLCKKKFKKFSNSAQIRPGAYIINCSKVSIGNRVIIRPNTMIFGDEEIIIEDDVLIGSGVHIYTGNHEFQNPNIPIIDQGHSKAKKVIIKKGSWIGANVIILPGITVGENSVIGAGSVVTKNVGAYTLVAGNPAILKKNII